MYVYVPVANGDTWSEAQKLVASDGADGDALGRVAILDSIIAVGARFEDEKGSDAGKIRVLVSDE